MMVCLGLASQILSFVCIQLLTCVLSTESQFPPLDYVKARISPEEQAAAVRGLILRLIPARVSEFNVTVDPSIAVPNRDTFIITTSKGKVDIVGTTGVAAAWGFQHYLKYYCGCHISWAGDQLSIPTPLPGVPSGRLNVTSNDRFRYYQNVCTVSYSFVWWNWTRWQREIDWMAMNAINLPLAFTGQEAIFQKVYLNLGYSNQDLQTFFTGPAFLAWGRMGNIEGFGGPLPQSWIDDQFALQRKILTRMRSFGMTPVLPAFAGHVPAATSRLFPNASVTRMGNWSHFNSTYSATYLLDFNDPLFKKIGSAVIQKMAEEFGTDHVYSADMFNEMSPKSSDLGYIAGAGTAVYGAMASVDPKAVWIMQGWLFLNQTVWKPPLAKALLTSVAKGKMLILDLMAEISPQYKRLESFYGQPFIWCMLHNFGGTLELYGAIESVNTGPIEGRRFPNSTMVGTGLAPEGINQNNVMYEFMNEHAWRTEPRDINQWIVEYAKRRYGLTNQYIQRAWNWLTISVYNSTTGKPFHGKNGYVRRPSLKLKTFVWYDPGELDSAWIELIYASSKVLQSNLFLYDFVDVTRQNLQVISMKYYQGIITAYNKKNITALRQAGSQFLGALDDLDKLLASDPHFLLGKWLEDAKNLSHSPDDMRLYEYNARNQITLWGPRGEIHDYASKEWAGLVGKFYKKRWSLFIDHLTNALTSGTKFNHTAYNEQCFLTIEEPFTFDTSIFPTTTQGDQYTIGVELYQKYHPFIPPSVHKERQIESKGMHKLDHVKGRLSRRNPAVFTFEE